MVIAKYTVMSMFVLKVAVALLVVAILQRATAQAPGDGSAVCNTLRERGDLARVSYPDNVRPLMDSRDYEFLLPQNENAVWQSVDNDDNNTEEFSTTWRVDADIQCDQRLAVCGFSAGAQNNWLITQHINRVVDGVPLAQVNVQVEFQLMNCNGSNSCIDSFVVHKYETLNISRSAAANITNYDGMEIQAAHGNITTLQTTVTILDFETEENGFYLAIQDKGTCIIVLRLLVFYYVCPAGVFDLIDHSEVISPSIGAGSFSNQTTSQCVPNASPNIDSAPRPVANCTAEGVWVTVSRCTCDEGFFGNLNGTACMLIEDTTNRLTPGSLAATVIAVILIAVLMIAVAALLSCVVFLKRKIKGIRRGDGGGGDTNDDTAGYDVVRRAGVPPALPQARIELRENAAYQLQSLTSHSEALHTPLSGPAVQLAENTASRSASSEPSPLYEAVDMDEMATRT